MLTLKYKAASNRKNPELKKPERGNLDTNASVYFQNISQEKFHNLFNALHKNTQLKSLSLANTAATDIMIKVS